MTEQPPPQKFERFECVLVVDKPHHHPELLGKSGTILWRDAIPAHLIQRPHLRGNRWMYLVYFAADNVYRTLLESDLRSECGFDPESAHLGKQPEFSFDVIVADDMDWIEGTYRLPGAFWEVMIFSKSDGNAIAFRANEPPLEWPSGISGTIFRLPHQTKLNCESVRTALTLAFGHEDWVEITGPDSIVLR